MEHGPAAPCRPAEAVDPDQVDVAGLPRNAILQYTRAFVDHRQDQPVGNRGEIERLAAYAQLFRHAPDQRFDLGVRDGDAAARRIGEISAANLLAKPAKFAQGIGNGGACSLATPDAPTDVQARQVGGRARPHAEPELARGLVDVLRQRAVL
ncbi:Uncharacterised protein [Bordetella pertussis]|nr:Uncharacterised protein [Bordetella pertussis]